MKRYIILGSVAGLGLLLAVIQFRNDRQTDHQISSPTNSASGSLQANTIGPSRNKSKQPSAPTGNVPENSGAPSSSVISALIGKGEPQSFLARLEAISKLGVELSLEQRQALYDYLLDPSEEKWLRPGQSFALKNDILNILQEQLTPPDGLTEVLLELRRNSSQPLVMRDYALQHMAPWFGKVGREHREMIVKELRTASLETDQSYAGTGLLALHRIKQETPDAEIPPLKEQIVRLVENPEADMLARITAVQMSGGLNLLEAREQISRIARDELQLTTLRIAAIGALGRIGEKEDHSYLGEATNFRDERLKLAAVSAARNLHRIEKP